MTSVPDFVRSVASAAALAALACTPSVPGGKEEPADATRPPIVLVSVDTLRSDRLPAYGYDGVDTPGIDRLAADGIVFERAWTHSNVTLPAHASLFTGLLPPAHGVRDNAGYRLKDLPTLASELKRQGYTTGGFVSSWVLRAGTGIGRGFDVYEDSIEFDSRRPFGQLQRLGTETLSLASEWLSSVGDVPFFLFLHLYEPHAPYEPPAPFRDRYEDPYDGEVAAADAVVGSLMERLEELGIYDEALVILLSDHGEGLMDHGEMDHLIFVYREVIQVPLILKLPARERAGERVDTNVQLADVMPTVLSFLGLPRLAGATGADLLELPAGPPRQIVSESVYPRIHFGWSDLASIVEDDLHFIDSPEPELFRLSVDPQERSNVIQEERAAARRLRSALAEIERTLTPPTEEDPETMERLRSLGYLSGGTPDEGLTLADPKSRIGVVGELARITRLIARGAFAEAEPALRAVLEQEPGMVDVWQQLGDVLERLRRPRAALEAYRTAFGLSRGEQAGAGLKVAELLLLAGRVAEAREHALAVVDRSPMAHNVLAQAAMLSNDLEVAEGHLNRAIAARGQQVTPLITRMAWLNRLGRFEETMASSEEVLREFGERQDREVLAHLYLHRGTALAALSRGDEAARDYRQAIELRPGLLGAYASLAFLHAVQGRFAETGRTLEEMVTANPNPAGYVEAVRTLRLMNDHRSADAVLREARDRWPDAVELEQLERRS